MFAAVETRYEPKYFMSFLWGLILAADLVTSMFFIAGERNMRRYVSNDYNADLIREFVREKEGADLSVILFGNSRLRYSVDFGFDPVKKVRLDNGRTMVALQFAPNAARFEVFEDVTYRILKAKPDLILLQDSVISNAKNPVPQMATYSKTVFNFLYTVWQGIDEYQEWQDDRLEILEDKDCYKEFTKEELFQQIHFAEDRDRHSLGEDNFSYHRAREFIKLARATGINVAVLRIPPNTEVLDRYGATIDQTDFNGLGHLPANEEFLPETHDFVAWLKDAPAPGQDHYCDYVHYNSRGRKLFSDWLKDELQKL